MKGKKLDGVEVWKEFEDVATRLGLNVVERAVYSHVLLHTRLEGKLRERFTTTEVACKVRISRGPVREAIRRLADLGALRFVERSYSGHLLEVRLPAEVPAARRRKTSAPRKAPVEVSCCTECNWQKKDHAAEDFLRKLYREGRLSRKDLSGGLRKLQALAAGKLRPQVLGEKNAGIFVGAKLGRASVSG